MAYLRQHPFDPVGRPETDAITRLQAQSDETSGEAIHLLLQRREGLADALVADNDGLLVRPAFGGFVQSAAQSIVNQRNRRRAMEVAVG